MLDSLAIPPSHQSVKLPSALVSAAKEEAQVFRRSISGQIEYWASLGRSMENAGLTAQQAREAVAMSDKTVQAKSLMDQFTQFSDSGQLADGVNAVIAANRRKASV